MENEASSKTKMDVIGNLWIQPLSLKLLIYGEIYEEIPLHFTYINGLDLSLSPDIGRYTILCGEMLQSAHKVSIYYYINHLSLHLTVLSQTLNILS